MAGAAPILQSVREDPGAAAGVDCVVDVFAMLLVLRFFDEVSSARRARSGVVLGIDFDFDFDFD